MTNAEIISTVALVISCLSFGLATYVGLRDRARLKTLSCFYPAWNENLPRVSVSIVNAGRRPVILRMWAGADKSGKWVGTYLGEEKVGLRLAEHERFDLILRREDLFSMTPDDDLVLNDMWFEDSLGRRHKVKNAKRNFEKLWNSRK